LVVASCEAEATSVDRSRARVAVAVSEPAEASSSLDADLQIVRASSAKTTQVLLILSAAMQNPGANRRRELHALPG